MCLARFMLRTATRTCFRWQDKAYKGENETLLTELRKHFYVEGIDIGENPTDKLELAKAEGVPSSSLQKDGVLMVMLYEDRIKKCLTDGSIAVGIKYTKDSMDIVQNLSNIGYVLQNPHLFSGTVKENIRYGRLDATDAEIEAAAKAVSK